MAERADPSKVESKKRPEPRRGNELPLLKTMRSRKALRRAARILEIVMYLHEIRPDVVCEALDLEDDELLRDLRTGQFSLRQMHCILELANVKPHAFFNAVLRLGLPGMQPEEEATQA